MKTILTLFAILFLILGCSSGRMDESPIKHLKVYFDEGKFHLEHRKAEQAIEFFNRALIDAQAEDNLYAIAVAYISLAQAYQILGNDKESLAYFNNANTVIPLINDEQPKISSYYMNLLLGQYFETLANFDFQKGDNSEGLANLKIAESYYSKALD